MAACLSMTSIWNVRLQMGHSTLSLSTRECGECEGASPTTDRLEELYRGRVGVYNGSEGVYKGSEGVYKGLEVVYKGSGGVKGLGGVYREWVWSWWAVLW